MVAIGTRMTPTRALLLLAVVLGLSACTTYDDGYGRGLRYVAADGCGDCGPCCRARGSGYDRIATTRYARPPVERHVYAPPYRAVERQYYAPPPRPIRRYANPFVQRAPVRDYRAPTGCDLAVRRPVASPCGDVGATRSYREIDRSYYYGGGSTYGDPRLAHRPAHYSSRRLYGSGRCCE